MLMVVPAYNKKPVKDLAIIITLTKCWKLFGILGEPMEWFQNVGPIIQEYVGNTRVRLLILQRELKHIMICL